MIDFEYLMNPEKYHTVPTRIEGEKDEQYKARLKAYVQGVESQQVKIDNLQKENGRLNTSYKNVKFQFENKQIDCDRSDRKIDELQARVDEVLRFHNEAKSPHNIGMIQMAIYLKGNKDETGLN